MRFMTAVDGRTPRPDILTPASIQAMTARPDVPTWATTPYWYALGWFVDTTGTWWHDGNLDGTLTFLLRKEEQGLTWVALCNTWPAYDYAFITAIDFGLWGLASAPRAWPTHDLFPLFTDAEQGQALTFALSAAFPNPFHTGTALHLTLDEAQPVRVEGFDVLGRSVAVLHDGPLSAGTHTVRFDGEGPPSGLYLVRATGTSASATRRVTLGR